MQWHIHVQGPQTSQLSDYAFCHLVAVVVASHICVISTTAVAALVLAAHSWCEQQQLAPVHCTA